MGRKLNLASTAWLTAVLVASTAVSQDAGDRPQYIGGLSFVDEVEVTVVNVDVFVRDKNGDPITDLKKEDFLLLQDGEQRTLTNFASFNEDVAAERFATSPGRATPVPPPVEEVVRPGGTDATAPEIKPIYIVLYIDNEALRPFDRNRVLTQVRRFLRDVMYPHVQVMVVSYERSLKIVEPFTNDKDGVYDAVKEVFRAVGGRTEYDTQRGRLLRDLSRARERYGVGTGSANPTYEQLDLLGRIQSYADQIANDLEFGANALREVTTSIGGLEGRKFLVYVSSGLPMTPGRDLFHEYSTVFQGAPTLTMLSRYNMKRLYDGVASAANAQGVAFLTIDASGLGGSGRVSAEYSTPIDPVTATIYSANQQETLAYLADSTGGRTILNANDISDGLEDFRHDLFTYYSLGYPISNSGTDRVHLIRVEVPDHPEYDLSYRRSFVEKSLVTQAQNTVISGLMYDLNANPIGISASTLAARPATGERWVVPLEISIPLESVALVEFGSDYVGKVVVFLAARDTRGKQSDLQQREHEIRIPATEYDTRRHERIVVEMDLLMDEGLYRVAVGVMDTLTRQSSFVTLDREVPGRL